MKKNNICKFTSSHISKSLKTHQFVLETNPDVMKMVKRSKTHQLFVVAEGSATMHLNDTAFQIQAGDLIFAFENETSYMENIQNLEYIYISFDGDRCYELFPQFNISPKNRMFNNYCSILPLWKETLIGANDLNINLASEGLLLYTLSKLKINAPEKMKISQKIIEIMSENFSDPNFGISTIAKKLAYNEKYLSHIFKKEMGVSFSNHLVTMRIQFATSLLNNGIDSVKNVAFLSGFTDALYFSTVFKKHMHMSPKEYFKLQHSQQNS